MTMESLEIRHDPQFHVSEASLQMKSNCGCLLIDDFGRQRIEPNELLNRWIIPLECRHDFLTLANGKKIKVPFEQLIIFSTNLEPSELADEAFLRRIPYKILSRTRTRTSFIACSCITRPNPGRVSPRRGRALVGHALSGRHPPDASLPSARSAQPTSKLLLLPRGSVEMTDAYMDLAVRELFCRRGSPQTQLASTCRPATAPA